MSQRYASFFSIGDFAAKLIPQLVEYPTKNSDRNKALELLGKRHQMWTDKVDINATVTETKKFDDIVSQLGGDGLDE